MDKYKEYLCDGLSVKRLWDDYACRTSQHVHVYSFNNNLEVWKPLKFSVTTKTFTLLSEVDIGHLAQDLKSLGLEWVAFEPFSL